MSKKLIGHACVDSGQLVIIDPCYLSEWKDGDFIGHLDPDSEVANSYDECCRVTCSDAQAGEVMKGLGVVTSTGWGDGEYPVYATFYGNRIAKIEIDFDIEPEEE